MTNPQPTPRQAPLLTYASPSPLARDGDVFRDGPVLIARTGITLIPFCILCGGPACDNPLRFKFSWDSSFKLTHISKLQLRAAGLIHAHLCPRHYTRWRRAKIIGLGGAFLSTLIMVSGVAVAMLSESSDIPRYTPYAIASLIAGFVLFTAFAFLFTLKTRTLTCRRIEEGYLYLDGVHERFLGHLPSLPATTHSIR